MFSIVHTVRRALTVAPDREAFVCDDRRLTFRAFDERLRRLHGALVGFGLSSGDRVAILSFNSIEFAELYCGIPMAAMVQVPLNFRWADPELRYALDDAGANVLFCDRDPGPLADLVDRVIRLDTGEYDALLDASEPVGFDDRLDENRLAGLFYTGGTTGASKGVMLSHRNLIANAWNAQYVQPLSGDDRYLIIAPMFHAAGSASLLQSIFVGATQVIMPAFAPGGMLDLVEAERVTQTLGVPTMLAATVDEQLASPRDVSSLTTYAHGGSPIALEVVRRGARAFPGTRFVHLYGATETAPLVTGLVDEIELLDDERGRSAGQPVLGCEVAIRGADGAPLPAGEPGEVTVRGANVMAGYWNKPEQTERALRDGWYWTGDVGRLDGEGYLFLLDRSKDMIVSGGENVYCTEVEDALYSHPAVLEATVFGIPDETWGEAVHAVVVLRDGGGDDDDDDGGDGDDGRDDAGDGESVSADQQALIAHCRERIAGYKVPRTIEFRAEPLPKSGPGKVLKRELREPHWAGHDASIG